MSSRQDESRGGGGGAVPGIGQMLLHSIAPYIHLCGWAGRRTAKSLDASTLFPPRLPPPPPPPPLRTCPPVPAAPLTSSRLPVPPSTPITSGRGSRRPSSASSAVHLSTLALDENVYGQTPNVYGQTSNVYGQTVFVARFLYCCLTYISKAKVST